MPVKGNNTIKYNHGEKSIDMSFTVYADLECLLEKMSTCQNDPNKSSIQYSHIVHSMNHKINLIIIEEMIT